MDFKENHSKAKFLDVNENNVKHLSLGRWERQLNENLNLNHIDPFSSFDFKNTESFSGKNVNYEGSHSESLLSKTPNSTLSRFKLLFNE